MTERYPLKWPLQKARTPGYARKRSQFGSSSHEPGQSWRSRKPITVAGAMKRLREELERIGVKEFILSSNLPLNRDGSPASGRRAPDDPGVAVYFQRQKQAVCLPCDTYETAEDNIAAVAKHIEATRAIERYGVASVREMFSGFTAIAAPGSKHWTAVLGLDLAASPDRIRAAHRLLYKQRAAMGSPEAALAELNAARDRALEERS